LSWQHNILPLAQGCSVYALDLAGHGLTDKPNISYTLDFGVAFLKDCLAALGLERASLVGCSVGGLLSLSLALRHPELVERLVLVGSAGLGRNVSRLLRLMTLPLLGEVVATPTQRKLRAFLKGIIYDSSLVEEEMVERMLALRRLPGARHAILSALRNGVTLTGVKPSSIFVGELCRVQSPTLIIWGEQDPIFPAEHARVAHRLVAGSSLHIFPQCGHWPQLERANEFNDLVLGFLVAQGAGTSRDGNVVNL
ncbi:MAG TPA: alpha/beta fold hydrolase, partial [Dehalococcoidia bacterium]|nr:alpha/beta fold hydrolase [Dehalococcoidia bacterium]